MEKRNLYIICTQAVLPIYEESIFSGDLVKSHHADECLGGMLLKVTGPAKDGYLPVITHYNYRGYVQEDQVSLTDLATAKAWNTSDLYAIDAITADVTAGPNESDAILQTLVKACRVKLLDRGEKWSLVQIPDGREGYIRTQWLQKAFHDDSFLWTGVLPKPEIQDEEAFRAAVIAEAKKYLGVQYRWAGKSTAGLDCSGLTGICYMLHGVLIYRDAQVVEGFPVKPIDKSDLKPGDLIYYEGHITLYMGDGEYIHSTGKAGSGGVVINSFNPEAPHYRGDMEDDFICYGSIF